MGFQAFLSENKLLTQDEKIKYTEGNRALSIQFTSYNSTKKIVTVSVLAELSRIAALCKSLCNNEFIKKSAPRHYRIFEY